MDDVTEVADNWNNDVVRAGHVSTETVSLSTDTRVVSNARHVSRTEAFSIARSSSGEIPSEGVNHGDNIDSIISDEHNDRCRVDLPVIHLKSSPTVAHARDSRGRYDDSCCGNMHGTDLMNMCQ